MSVGRVVIYGGRGALGATVVSHFKANNWVKKYSLSLHRLTSYVAGHDYKHIFFHAISFFLIKKQIKTVGWFN